MRRSTISVSSNFDIQTCFGMLKRANASLRVIPGIPAAPAQWDGCLSDAAVPEGSSLTGPSRRCSLLTARRALSTAVSNTIRTEFVRPNSVQHRSAASCPWPGARMTHQLGTARRGPPCASFNPPFGSAQCHLFALAQSGVLRVPCPYVSQRGVVHAVMAIGQRRQPCSPRYCKFMPRIMANLLFVPQKRARQQLHGRLTRQAPRLGQSLVVSACHSVRAVR